MFATLILRAEIFENIKSRTEFSPQIFHEMSATEGDILNVGPSLGSIRRYPVLVG